MKTAAGPLNATQVDEIRNDVGPLRITVANSFDDATAKMRLHEDYRFGSSATAGTKNVRTLSDLDAYFINHPSPASDGFSYVTQNGYWTYEQLLTGSANYVFGANDLTLQPTTPQDISASFVTEIAAAATVNSGSATPMATLGLSSTSGLWVGRVVVLPYSFNNTARVAAFDSTTVTLQSLNRTFTGNLAHANGVLAIWTRDTLIVYQDGFPMARFRGSWASRRALRIHINASLGGFDYLKAQQYPQSPAALAASKAVLRSFKVWKR